MASLTIRDLDEQTKERLRVRAARRGHSMEAETRHILREAVAMPDVRASNLADAIRRRFSVLEGVELELAPREAIRESQSSEP